MTIEQFNLQTPFPDIFPAEWKKQMSRNTDFMAFRNLDHFRKEVKGLTQKNDHECGMPYAEALDRLLRGVSEFPPSEQESIRDLVRSNLHKRGLISEEVYEAYRYTVDGTAVGIDVGKFAAGEPDCVITPQHQYIDFFYELYVSVSYPHYVTNEKIRSTVAKLLATIEELERQHIFIKVTLVLPIRDITNNSSRDFFAAVPLFSHKDPKSVGTMSSVLNDRLLRKFFFAVMEATYKTEISHNYGYAISMPGAMSVGDDFNEVEFFESIAMKVGV